MNGHVVLLNGPAGVGKTCVATFLSGLVPGSVCIHGDELRGFAPVDARDWLGPGSTYRAAAVLASAYLQMGAPRVIFDYVFESSSQVELFRQSAAAGVTIHLVTLWAPLDVVLRREEHRPERTPLGVRVQQCYRALEANLENLGVLIGTADASPEQVAHLVNAEVIAALNASKQHNSSAA